jgi:lipoate---protein ligase
MQSSTQPWLVERLEGNAGEVLRNNPLRHPDAPIESGPPPVRPLVRFVTVRDRAVVLGAAQRDDLVDTERAQAAGVSIVRRSSGGGAVWVAPDEMVWVDVVIPTADDRWVRDVNVAFLWLGDVWREALIAVGMPGDEVAVHRGGLVRNDVSSVVCFAGLGPGEVTANRRKIVGISQKRTRSGAWFQCGALLRWNPNELLGVLANSHITEAELANVAAPIRIAAPVLERAFLNALLGQQSEMPHTSVPEARRRH